MLPPWDPESLSSVVPFVVGTVGARRTGKSTAIAHLLFQLSSKFDLVICFIGSAACNPVIESMMDRFWDRRFFFPEWNQPLIDKLLEQQERLRLEGRKRNICILVDDVILSSSADDSLAHLAMRGRHFGISLVLAAVSYTSLPKRVRRSLDVLILFSCGMQGDRKVLLWEYANNAAMAGFALSNLEDHQCLVLETCQRRQQLKVWRAGVLTVQDLTRTPCIRCDELRRRAARGKPSVRRCVPRSTERCGASCRTLSPGRGPAGAPEDETEQILQPLSLESGDEDPGSVEV